MADTVLTELKIHDFDTLEQYLQHESEIGDNDISFTPDMSTKLFLFKHAWADYLVSDVSWLRADTFSWQSGDVYKAAYDHLTNDMRTVYAWADRAGSYGFNVYTESATPSVGDNIYDENGSVIGSCSSFNSSFLGWTDSDGTTYSSWLREVSSDFPSARTETIGDITITYYLAQDGHKICLPDQESNIVALYESTGVAWYYILDTENKQFKLPRENKDGKYLYFYVGNFEQDAVEQTAGLNTELFNNKADRNLLNTTDNVDIVIESQLPTAENNYTWYRKYKSGWVEQGGISSVTGYATTSNSNITLPVEMSDINYTVVATINGAGENVAVGNSVSKKSTAAISLRINFNSSLTRTMSWQVSGMSAQ